MPYHTRREAVVHTSIILYIVYIFTLNWASSAEKLQYFNLQSTLSLASSALLAICCILTVYGLLQKKQTYLQSKYFTIITTVLILFLAASIQSISIVLPIVLGLLTIRLSNRDVARTIVKSLVTLLALSTILHFFGLNGGDSLSKPLFGLSGEDAYMVPALGLSNPNGVMLIFINIVILSLFLCRSKKRRLQLSVALLVLSTMLSVVTGSSTGLIMNIAAILIVNLALAHRTTLKLLTRITPWMFLIVTLLTFIVAVAFGPRESLPNPVNSLLTTRPFTWNLRIENGTYFNLLGANDEYMLTNETTQSLDNMTLYTLVHYGMVTYLILLTLFFVGAKKTSDPALVVYIFIACALLFVERMYLYSLVLLFLQKSIAEYYLGNSQKTPQARQKELAP